MSNVDKNHALPADSPLAAHGRTQFSEFADHLGKLTEVERARYQGKLLAVHSGTGKILAAADSLPSLQAAVAEAGHAKSRWRVVDGPTGEEPLSLSDLQ